MLTVTTEWGDIPYRIEEEHIAFQSDALFTTGRAWTRKNDPTRLHLVGGSAPF